METYRITSTEYKANEPQTFLFVNGEYFGDLAYVRRDKFPQNADHWDSAICADSDRHFIVRKVEVTEVDVAELRDLHAAIDTKCGELMEYTTWRPGMTKAEVEADRQQNLRTEELNRPIYAAIRELSGKVQDIIASLNEIDDGK